tara:strand:+ start:2079 stop:2513 length:435 start_codon:yes stop_codon:yes gene_type:complete
MATTIAPTQLTTTVQETITLNGVTFNSANTRVVTSITNYVNNVFNVQTGSQQILTFSRTGIAPAGTEYNIDKLKYIRLTNSDDALSVTLTIQFVTTKGQLINLAPGGTFILSEFIVANSSDTLTSITVTSTGVVDIPYAIGLIS